METFHLEKIWIFFRYIEISKQDTRHIEVVIESVLIAHTFPYQVIQFSQYLTPLSPLPHTHTHTLIFSNSLPSTASLSLQPPIPSHLIPGWRCGCPHGVWNSIPYPGMRPPNISLCFGSCRCPCICGWMKVGRVREWVWEWRGGGCCASVRVCVFVGNKCENVVFQRNIKIISLSLSPSLYLSPHTHTHPSPFISTKW